MSSTGDVRVLFRQISDIIIVCLEMEGHKYFLSSMPDTDMNEVFESISDCTNVSPFGLMTTSPELMLDDGDARTLWRHLVDKLHFERINDLESNANYKYRDSNVTVYKIRDKDTKKYSRGGNDGGSWLWTNKGKYWNQLNHIQSHITQLNHGSSALPDVYKKSELVELGEIRSIDMTDFDNFKKSRK